MRTILVVAAVAVAALAARADAKPRAPVQVDARLGDGAAHLVVRFDAAARGVGVRVYGVGGLRVTSPARPIAGATVAAGEVRELDVRFTAPEGRSDLVVEVSGRFPGGRRAAVQSFAVGLPGAAQPREAAGRARTTPSGERLKPLPADEGR